MATRDKPDKKLTPLETLIMNVLWDECTAGRSEAYARSLALPTSPNERLI